MQFRNCAVVAVALLVLLSGCGAFGVTQSDDPSNETDVEGDNVENESTTDDGDETADDEGDGTDHEDETTDSKDESTANAEWNPPAEPNRPLEDKREDRIESVEFVDKEPAADGNGYSNFNLEVVANTSMENVDPPEHGNVIGEPYFFVKINEDEQKLIERTGQVSMDENGTYHIEVRPAGIEEFGDGPLTVEVFLMDEDKDWDDIYAAVGQEIHFNPGSDGDAAADDSGTGGDAEEETDSETTEN